MGPHVRGSERAAAVGERKRRPGAEKPGGSRFVPVRSQAVAVRRSTTKMRVEPAGMSGEGDCLP